LTLAIAFWKFENPLRLQLPKWRLPWECEGSFPHILLHSQKHEMWFPGSLLAYTFASPCFGREPKARVATIIASYNQNCLLTKAIHQMTPKEKWNECKPIISHFRIFGNKLYIHIPNKLKTKLKDKNLKCILMKCDEHS
jgi:hypothetical protein